MDWYQPGRSLMRVIVDRVLKRKKTAEENKKTSVAEQITSVLITMSFY